jgi:hypothetical protein
MKRLFSLLFALLCPLAAAAAEVTLAPAAQLRAPVMPEYATVPFVAADVLPPRFAGHDAEGIYTALSAAGENAALPGNLQRDGLFAFTVDLESSANNWQRGYNKLERQLELHYLMGGNQITEGWNWQPQADPQMEDYYRYKYLMLKDYTLDNAKEGIWKYEFMLAFDNLYDFYPRTLDDEAGFSARIPVAREEAVKLLKGDTLRMLAVCRLIPPFHAQSSTFWKATASAPYDFWLKKRYLYAKLLEVWFYDTLSGKVLARVKPMPKDARQQ